VLRLSNVLVGEVKHGNYDKGKTDKHRYETILIFIKLMHLLILLHSSHAFANMLYLRIFSLIFFSAGGILMR
jgi:hypothetical protein